MLSYFYIFESFCYTRFLLITQLVGNIGWSFEKWGYLRGNEKLLQTLTKYDKMKLVYLEKDATYEISRTQ